MRYKTFCIHIYDGAYIQTTAFYFQETADERNQGLDKGAKHREI
jgi:hypothetical protein